MAWAVSLSVLGEVLVQAIIFVCIVESSILCTAATTMHSMTAKQYEKQPMLNAITGTYVTEGTLQRAMAFVWWVTFETESQARPLLL